MIYTLFFCTAEVINNNVSVIQDTVAKTSSIEEPIVPDNDTTTVDINNILSNIRNEITENNCNTNNPTDTSTNNIEIEIQDKSNDLPLTPPNTNIILPNQNITGAAVGGLAALLIKYGIDILPNNRKTVCQINQMISNNKNLINGLKQDENQDEKQKEKIKELEIIQTSLITWRNKLITPTEILEEQLPNLNTNIISINNALLQCGENTNQTNDNLNKIHTTFEKNNKYYETSNNLSTEHNQTINNIKELHQVSNNINTERNTSLKECNNNILQLNNSYIEHSKNMENKFEQILQTLSHIPNTISHISSTLLIQGASKLGIIQPQAYCYVKLLHDIVMQQISFFSAQHELNQIITEIQKLIILFSTANISQTPHHFSFVGLAGTGKTFMAKYIVSLLLGFDVVEFKVEQFARNPSAYIEYIKQYYKNKRNNQPCGLVLLADEVNISTLSDSAKKELLNMLQNNYIDEIPFIFITTSNTEENYGNNEIGNAFRNRLSTIKFSNQKSNVKLTSMLIGINNCLKQKKLSDFQNQILLKIAQYYVYKLNSGYREKQPSQREISNLTLEFALYINDIIEIINQLLINDKLEIKAEQLASLKKIYTNSDEIIQKDIKLEIIKAISNNINSTKNVEDIFIKSVVKAVRHIHNPHQNYIIRGDDSVATQIEGIILEYNNTSEKIMSEYNEKLPKLLCELSNTVNIRNIQAIETAQNIFIEKYKHHIEVIKESLTQLHTIKNDELNGAIQI